MLFICHVSYQRVGPLAQKRYSPVTFPTKVLGRWFKDDNYLSRILTTRWADGTKTIIICQCPTNVLGRWHKVAKHLFRLTIQYSLFTSIHVSLLTIDYLLLFNF